MACRLIHTSVIMSIITTIISGEIPKRLQGREVRRYRRAMSLQPLKRIAII